MPENPAWPLQRARTAVLVMDYQESIIDTLDTEETKALLGRAAALSGAARDANVRVIYVVISFRAGHPEASPNNKSFSPVKSAGRLVEGAPGSAVHPAVAPRPGDLVVTKRRVSAFAGSDLELLLRSLQVDTLLLAGIATSGVVLSTLRQAADLDYRLAVVADACADRDAEVHRVLTRKVFPRQAEVMDTAAAVGLLVRSTG